MGRRPELDALRGLMLVWIALTHLPTSASTYVNQPFGFVSAAEGFIFLSALFTGRIYFRMAVHDGYWPMTRKLWTRTLRLYGYHALLLAFMFLVAVPIASRGNRPGLHNLLYFYFMVGAKQSITEAALLIYRPPLLDILPMYIIFLAFTSTGLLLARKIGWKPILLGGFVIWGFAQFGFRNAEHSFMMRFIPTRIPLNEMGSFDLWAWQFLWISGIWLGVRWGQVNLPIEKWARRVVIGVLIKLAVQCGAVHQRTQQLEAVLHAEHVFAGALRMRHHAQDVAPLVADAGDIFQRSVGIGFRGNLPLRSCIAEDHLLALVQLLQRGLVAEVIPLAMPDGHLQHLARSQSLGEGRSAAFHPQVDRLADVLQAAVAQQDSGEQVRFAENLEAVADAQDEAAAFGKTLDRLHDGRKARNRPGAQVIAIGKAARHHDDVAVLKIVRVMPEQRGGLSANFLERPIGVVVAIASGKYDDAKLHGRLANPAG